MKNSKNQHAQFKDNKSSSKSGGMLKNNRILLTFICIFMSVIIIFGGTLLGVTLARQASYTVKYEGFGMDTKTAAYFASYYKYKYVASLRAEGVGAFDTAQFWSSKGEGEEKSYGEYLKEGTAEFIKQTTVAAYLFDKYATLTDRDEERIKDAISYKLDNPQLGMDGSEGTFNSLVSEYGFDYDSYEKAAEILYKAQNARQLLGGLFTEVFPDGYDEYLTTYARVGLLFVNDNQKLNSNGVLVNMTSEERAAQEADIAELRTLISNGTASAETFQRYFDDYNTVRGMTDNGEYYLGMGERFTETLAEEFPAVAERAFEMELTADEAFSEVAYEGGVCFIYKTAPSSKAYEDESLKAYFEDFEENASYYLYDSILKMYSEDAVITEKFYNIDIIATPYNSDYFIEAF